MTAFLMIVLNSFVTGVKWFFVTLFYGLKFTAIALWYIVLTPIYIIVWLCSGCKYYPPYKFWQGGLE